MGGSFESLTVFHVRWQWLMPKSTAGFFSIFSCSFRHKKTCASFLTSSYGSPGKYYTPEQKPHRHYRRIWRNIWMELYSETKSTGQVWPCDVRKVAWLVHREIPDYCGGVGRVRDPRAYSEPGATRLHPSLLLDREPHAVSSGFPDLKRDTRRCWEIWVPTGLRSHRRGSLKSSYPQRRGRYRLANKQKIMQFNSIWSNYHQSILWDTSPSQRKQNRQAISLVTIGRWAPQSSTIAPS